MSIRRQPLITGQMYHIYNCGVDKRDIFADKNDIYRFIESIKEFNREDKINSLANLRKSKQNPQIEVSPLSGMDSKEPLVEIIGYCLNPNHFHLILKQSVDSGISKFMQKLLGGYTYYFNSKNTRSGSLFQGLFKSQLIVNENYFNKLIGYVNKNYLVHSIPENKNDLVFSGDFEYENSKFNIISKKEGENILEVFG
ncbi:transposase, partial [Candidatus Nomurabacteria bacterium]|nr:transposase [Candidatus Nomurabacteria bacterium]